MDSEIRKKILTLLDQHRIMTIATLRPDGWPQATTVGYVSEGLTLYFLCGRESQKAANLARDDRVSLTIDHDTPDIMAITGLSMAARAHEVVDPKEATRIIQMLPLKYPEKIAVPMPIAIAPPATMSAVEWPPAGGTAPTIELPVKMTFTTPPPVRVTVGLVASTAPVASLSWTV